MPETLASPAPARPRYRALLAAFALVTALIGTSGPLSAVADETATGSISGTVTTPDGQPASNVFVNISIGSGEGTSFFESTITDGDGHYAFADLALDTYYLQLTAFGYQNYPGQSVTLTTESPSSVIDIALQDYAVGLGSISGVVTADGVPLANLNVSAHAYTSGQFLNTTTDEFGYYTFTGLANGQWSVNASPGLGYQFLIPPAVNLTDEAPTATADLAFLSWPTGTSSITGVVSDSATGAPVAGLQVSAFGNDVAHNSSVFTDEAGVYSFDLLPAGSFRLNVFTPGYLTNTAEVQVAEGETVTANLSLVAATSTITGHVKDKQGAPLAGVYVNAHTATGDFGFGETDENGNYTITEVGAVAYTLTIGGPGTPYKEKSKVVTPAVNGSATANFTLKPRTTGSLSGFVNGPDSNPFTEPVCVNLHSSKNKKVIAESVTLGPDFGDGTYFFGDLKPGAYTLSFEDCDDDPALAFDTVFYGGAKTWASATFITVTAAEDSYGNDFTITYRTATSTISGHVQKGNGTALAGLTVTATDGTSVAATAVTDANGDYTLTGLFTDRYTVTVGGEGTLYKQKQKHVTTIDTGDVIADFTLAKK